jgi:hypothetical protein
VFGNHFIQYLCGIQESLFLFPYQSYLDLQDVTFKGDPSVRRVEDLKAFMSKLKVEWEEAKRLASQEELHELLTADLCSDILGGSLAIDREETCSICYACEVDTMFIPCKHQSCQRCISRHLLNNQRCFFCNATISELCSMLPPTTTPLCAAGVNSQCPAAADSNGTLTRSTTGHDLQSHSSRGSLSRLHNI